MMNELGEDGCRRSRYVPTTRFLNAHRAGAHLEKKKLTETMGSLEEDESMMDLFRGAESDGRRGA